jgi:hypothetical protein
MSRTRHARQPRDERKRVAYAVARRLVEKYLRDCGGPDSGFTFERNEEALAAAIERELLRRRGDA